MKDKKHIIEIVQGVEGKSIYINDTRIDGNKPWGGGKKIATFCVSAQDLIDNVPELKEFFSKCEPKI